MVHEHVAQLSCRYREEVRSILPIDWRSSTKTQIDFVDQCSSLQRVLAMFAAHFAGSNPVQLAIYELRRAVGCFLVSGVPVFEQAGDRA